MLAEVSQVTQPNRGDTGYAKALSVLDSQFTKFGDLCAPAWATFMTPDFHNVEMMRHKTALHLKSMSRPGHKDSVL